MFFQELFILREPDEENPKLKSDTTYSSTTDDAGQQDGGSQ
jgi:hypothetical protein